MRFIERADPSFVDRSRLSQIEAPPPVRALDVGARSSVQDERATREIAQRCRRHEHDSEYEAPRARRVQVRRRALCRARRRGDSPHQTRSRRRAARATTLSLLRASFTRSLRADRSDAGAAACEPPGSSHGEAARRRADRRRGLGRTDRPARPRPLTAPAPPHRCAWRPSSRSASRGPSCSSRLRRSGAGERPSITT